MDRATAARFHRTLTQIDLRVVDELLLRCDHTDWMVYLRRGVVVVDIEDGGRVETGSAPLSGLRVLDLSDSLAGQYCGRLLANAGAAVLLVEPPSGTGTRRLPPFGVDGNSLTFWNANAGKESVGLATETGSGRSALQAAAQHVHVAVVDSEQDAAFLQRCNASLVVALVSEFGPGPYEHWRGTEMIHQALAGVMLVTGDADRKPLYGCGYRAYYATGTLAFIGILGSLCGLLCASSRQTAPPGPARWSALEETGGDRVVVSVFGTAATMAMNLSTLAAYNGAYPERGKYRGFLARIRCCDGWVMVFGGRHWSALCEVFDAPDLSNDDRFRDPLPRMEHWPEAVAAFQARAEARTVDEIVREAQARKVAIERMRKLPDVLSAPHFRDREVFSRSTVNGRLRLGPLLRMERTPLETAADAPGIGSAKRWIRAYLDDGDVPDDIYDALKAAGVVGIGGSGSAN